MSLGVERLGIELESETAVYEAGETVIGQVVLQLAAPRLVSTVSVTLRGDSETTASVRAGALRRARLATSSEQHFCKSLTVLGSLHQLAPGVHTFPFCFALPERLPSSFQGRMGRVRYQAQAAIECDNWSAACTDAATPFSVVARIDLNSLAAARNPVSLKQKYSTLLPKKSCLRLKGVLHRPALVPGEHLAVSGELSASGAVCARVKLELFQVVKYSVAQDNDARSVTEAELVADAEYPRELQDLQLDLSTMRMRIPPLPPSTAPTHGGRLVHISYSLRLTARDTVKDTTLIKVNCPIIVGCTPLHLRQALAPQDPSATVTSAASAGSSGYVTEDDDEPLLDLTCSTDASGRTSPPQRVPALDPWGTPSNQTLSPRPAVAGDTSQCAELYVPSQMSYNVQEWDPICV